MKKAKRSSDIQRDHLSINSPHPDQSPLPKNEDYFDEEDVKSMQDENKRLKEEMIVLKASTPNELLLKDSKEIHVKYQLLVTECDKLNRERELKSSSNDQLVTQMANLEFKVSTLTKENSIKSERVVDLLTEIKTLKHIKLQMEEYEKVIARLEQELLRQRKNAQIIHIVKPFAQVLGYIVGEPVQYRIKVESNQGSYEIKKRYKEFLTLNGELCKNRKDLPKFPEKMLIGNRAEENLKKRCDGLTSFVDFISGDKELLQTKAVQVFFAK